MPAVAGSAAGQASASGNLRRHARTQIRRAAADLLKPDVGSAWALVWQSRVDYPRELWNYIKIYTDREDAQRITVNSPPLRERSVSLNVVAMIRVSNNFEEVEDRMDDLAVHIETLLNEDDMREQWAMIVAVDLQTSAMDIVLNAEEKIDHAELTLNFSVRYRTLDGAPESLV
jgi:hypothetical protein